MSIWAVFFPHILAEDERKSVHFRNDPLANSLEESIIYATSVAKRRFHEQEDAFDCGDSHLLFSVCPVEFRELRGGEYSAYGAVAIFAAIFSTSNQLVQSSSESST